MRSNAVMHTTLDAQSFMHRVSIFPMSNEADRARQAFAKFLKVHSLSGRAVSAAGGLSPSAASQFILGHSRSPKADTFSRFAKGASEKLGRAVTVGEMLGEAQAEIQLPISSYVGAGDEVVAPVEGDGPIDYVAAPPELAEGEVLEVRGRSMLPAYEHGDLLFHRFMDPDPRNLLGKLVIAKLKDGRRFVKVLQPGSKRGRFTLTSLNPSYAPMEDQAVAAVARIVWVKKKG